MDVGHAVVYLVYMAGWHLEELGQVFGTAVGDGYHRMGHDGGPAQVGEDVVVYVHNLDALQQQVIEQPEHPQVFPFVHDDNGAVEHEGITHPLVF